MALLYKLSFLMLELFPNSCLVISFQLLSGVCFIPWPWLGSYLTLRCVNGFFILSCTFEKKSWLLVRVTEVKD